MAQPHGQHRHRLRLRRQAHGPALPGAGVRLGPGARGRTASRPGRSCPPSSTAPASRRSRRTTRCSTLEDVLGKRIVATRLRGNVTIREENAAAALEVMSRFAADPSWLIYLPPTMSPCETSRRAGPAGAPGRGVRLLPQPGCPAGRLRGEAHGLAGGRGRLPGRGGRPGERFGVTDGERRASSTPAPAGGSSTTPSWSAQFLDRVRDAADGARASGTSWTTDWVLPRLRADALVGQGAGAAADAVRAGRARRRGIAAASGVDGAGRGGRRGGVEVEALADARCASGGHVADRFVAAYRRYCWPVHSLDDLKLAPFHLLATEGTATRTRTTPGTWTPWPRSARARSRAPCWRPRTESST